MTPPKATAKSAPPAAPVEAQPLPEKGIGGRIKEARLRKENDLTIEALSRLCKIVDPAGQGIAQPTIVRYEKTEVLPGARELRVLCAALNVSADWLILGKEFEGLERVDAVMGVLSDMIKVKLVKENPLWFLGDEGEKERRTLLAKAKEPQPRK